MHLSKLFALGIEPIIVRQMSSGDDVFMMLLIVKSKHAWKFDLAQSFARQLYIDKNQMSSGETRPVLSGARHLSCPRLRTLFDIVRAARFIARSEFESAI
jgi:hypothetical protein